MIPATQREALAVLAELCEMSPDVRLGQLLAHLGFLGEDQTGRSLWDIDDEQLLAVIYHHRAELAARQPDSANQTPGLPPVPPQTKPSKVDAKAVEGYVKSIKTRLLPYKAEPGKKERESPTGLMERDKQVEIFVRFAIMRLDEKEINEDNLIGISKYVVAPGDSGPIP